MVLLTAFLAKAGIPGDVNGDAAVNVADVQCIVLAVLGGSVPVCLGAAGADLNCDKVLDVVDIQLEVLVVLYHPQLGIPPDQDGNGNNLHDNCEQEEQAVCGNTVVESGEDCDDGNTKGGDGCSPTCKSEPYVCGNGIVESPWEDCDPPGNPNAKGEHCNADCFLPGSCCGDCGDGMVSGTEECDDGCMKGVPGYCEPFVDDGDGCSYSCELENT
jgi:cysteine-rich repeat protein